MARCICFRPGGKHVYGCPLFVAPPPKMVPWEGSQLAKSMGKMSGLDGEYPFPFPTRDDGSTRFNRIVDGQEDGCFPYYLIVYAVFIIFLLLLKMGG